MAWSTGVCLPITIAGRISFCHPLSSEALVRGTVQEHAPALSCRQITPTLTTTNQSHSTTCPAHELVGQSLLPLTHPEIVFAHSVVIGLENARQWPRASCWPASSSSHALSTFKIKRFSCELGPWLTPLCVQACRSQPCDHKQRRLVALCLRKVVLHDFGRRLAGHCVWHAVS